MDKQKEWEESRDKLYSFLDKEDYEGAVQFLETIKDKGKRKELCFLGLSIEGMKKAMAEYGSVVITPDKEKYERAKSGLEEDIGPYNVLHVKDFDKNSKVEGIEEMLDFVPEDNPLKKFRELV